MPTRKSASGSELFIVDNSDADWKAIRYLRDWCQLSKGLDIATGYFEIGSLLALEGEWRKVDKIRILMGDEVSRRTQKAFAEGLSGIAARLDGSLEAEKDKNDFLDGVPAIVEALRSKKIECRVYRKDKFHAKAYITQARLDVVGAAALVGSSNMTRPGLTENIELNVQITGAPVKVLQEWYEEHWERAEDVTPEILRVVERHVHEYSPFEVYAKALQEFFRGHEMTASEWEREKSAMYRVLAPYQREGYHGLLKKAAEFRGAFLCDGVGLGKTFVGMMLIERFIMHDRLNVALFVPKSTRDDVWERDLKKYLPDLRGPFGNRLEIYNHTDLLRGGKYPEEFEAVRKKADVIIVDEAHHFRNTGTRGQAGEPRKSQYWKLFDLVEGKKVFMLTATPINNRLTDLQHMIELFTHQEPDYFKTLGIHSLPGHFRKMEKTLEKAVAAKRAKASDEDVGAETDMAEAKEVLHGDDLFSRLVVQRSRAYVKKSLKAEGEKEILFPKPRDPKVVPYSVKQTYGKILKKIEDAFNKDKPLFALAVYYPLAYYKGNNADTKPLEEGRQKQVVALIRTGFLKRFESSVEAFHMSCWRLLKKLLAWMEVHAEDPADRKRLDRWKGQHRELLGNAVKKEQSLWPDQEDEAEEDFLPPELLEAIEKEKLPAADYKLSEIITETLLDLDQIALFLNDLEEFKPEQDKKLTALKQLLKNDSTLREQKVLIFSEFMDTARYLKIELQKAGFDAVEEIDSAVKRNRSEIIRCFAPYYNDSSGAQLQEKGTPEIRILIATDVLSEGLNLQDCTRLINYDLHWNPVRLMQRIGRIDRRMNPEIEAKIVADHPEQKKLRGEVAYWNFLPPDELDDLLKLYQLVARKTLRISKTFGIEGRKLLKPEDDYEDLRDFSEAYEGGVSPVEELKLELQSLLKKHPELENRLATLPGRVFSGKEHPQAGSRAVFFCYALPEQLTESGAAQAVWTVEAGRTGWYLFDLATEKILTEAPDIAKLIRSTPKTMRRCAMQRKTLAEIRAKIEKQIKDTYLKRVQAPVGVKPALKAWMEMS